MFPFKIYNAHSAYYKLVMANKPKDETWYEIDLVVTSPTTGILKVYGLQYASQPFENGSSAMRTDESRDFEITFETAEIEPSIEKQLRWVATARRERELYEEEERIISLYAEETRKMFGL